MSNRIPAGLRSPVLGLAAAGTAVVGAAAVFGPGVMALAAATGGAIAIGGSFLFARGRGAWGLLLARTRIDYRREVGDPATNSIVGAVAGWIARNFPEAPVRIQVEGAAGDAPVILPGPSGPGAMLRLLERPNPFYSGVLQWMATIVDYVVSSNAYWFKQRSASGRVIALWWIPQGMIEPRWPENDQTVFISHYEYRLDGKLYAIRVEDIVHFRNGIDPLNTRKGLSRLNSLFREIFTDDEAANFTAALLRNLGVPGVVIAPSNTVANGAGAGGIDVDVVKQTWMDKTTGDKRGEPFVSNIPIDVKSFAFNPQQMQLRELRRVPEERISAVLGVPAGVAGLGAGLDRNTFSNYGEANKAAYTQGVIPLHRLIAAELEVQLLPEFADIERTAYDVFFDWTLATAMLEAAGEIWKRYESAATKGLVTRGAFKRATGQKADASDDVYIRPNNYISEPAGSSPAGSVTRRATVGSASTPLLEAGPVQPLLCGGTFRGKPCGKLLAEQASSPYRLTCDRCKTVASSAPDPVVVLEADPAAAA